MCRLFLGNAAKRVGYLCCWKLVGPREWFQASRNLPSESPPAGRGEDREPGLQTGACNGGARRAIVMKNKKAEPVGAAFFVAQEAGSVDQNWKRSPNCMMRGKCVPFRCRNEEVAAQSPPFTPPMQSYCSSTELYWVWLKTLKFSHRNSKA
jgi:hypothetical protein